MYHFDRSEIERDAKIYISFVCVAQAKSFLYNACCLRVEQVEWKPEWNAIFFTLMYTYLARKRDACVEIHPLMYNRSKACFTCGTESDI